MSVAASYQTPLRESIYRNIDLGVTGQVIKSDGGEILSGFLSNNAATARFVKFYNKATAPTATDTPIMTVELPLSSTIVFDFTHGIPFSTGISIRATQLVASSDATAPVTNDVIVNLIYQ